MQALMTVNEVAQHLSVSPSTIPDGGPADFGGGSDMPPAMDDEDVPF
jgi:hypothetical protein